MKRLFVFFLFWSSFAGTEKKVTLMSNEALHAIRDTVSGAGAKATVRELSQMHRVQASEGYRRAAELMRERAAAYGLSDARIERMPADGETLYRHFRSYYGGRRTVREIRDAVSAELGPVPLEAVTEYLELLARAGVVRFQE